jgi:hypothetical protein
MACRKGKNMAKTQKKAEKAEKSVKELESQTMKERVEKLIQEEYIVWREELKKYWPGIDKMQDMWEFYKSEKEKSPSKISLNTGFAIVESMVAKSNETKLKVSASAKGINGLKEVEDYIAATVKDSLEDRDIELLYGPFRKRKEMHFRDYLVKGNAFSEDQYVYKTQIINGEKKVIADNPVTEVLSYKSVIFNPAYYADNSPVYWVEKNTTWKALKDNELDKKTGKGLYVNLGALKANCDKSGKLIDHSDEKVIQDGKKRSRKVEPIQLLIRWEGCKMTVIADQHTIIREAIDPFKTGRHNLHISMNYKVEGRPYAYGELDPIYKPVRAQDTIVNQNISAINKYLEPAMTYDPDDMSVNIDQIIDVLENGGIAPARKDSINTINRVLPPSQAFTTIESIQQAIERSARWSAYSAGMTNTANDKTQGTAQGINSLIAASEPNFQVKLDDLRDTYYIPVASNYLTMIANLMGKDDIRRSRLMGKKPDWVLATKNLLMGKLNAKELLKSGVLKEEEFIKFITDEATGQQFPELAEEVLYDVDWLINITLDNQAEQDKMEKTKKKNDWFMQCAQMGLPMDAKKFMLDNGEELDIEDPEQYIKDPEVVQQEQAQQQEQMQQEQAQAQEQEMQKEQMKHQMNMEAKQTELQAKQGMTEEQIQAQMQMAQMKQGM